VRSNSAILCAIALAAPSAGSEPNRPGAPGRACGARTPKMVTTDGMLRLGDRSRPLHTPDTRPVKLQASGFVRE
jgi:hypothetical protein